MLNIPILSVIKPMHYPPNIPRQLSLSTEVLSVELWISVLLGVMEIAEGREILAMLSRSHVISLQRCTAQPAQRSMDTDSSLPLRGDQN